MRNEAYKKYEEKLKLWIGHPHKNNIRMLLSTLHTVMWDGSGWNTITMGDVIKPSSVKVQVTLDKLFQGN